MDLRGVRAFVLIAGALALGGGAGSSAAGAVPFSVSIRTGAAADPVVVAAGDIACDPITDGGFNSGNGTATACRMKATAALLAGATAVLPLGDTQYQDGTFAKYGQSYTPSWGTASIMSVTRPAVGNHEYLTSAAADYFRYFGTKAGDPTKGYYAFDLGSWHLIALNSEIARSATSTQVQWLRANLASNTKPCILAYWHQPRFSSGMHGDNTTYDAFWRALYDFRADVVLNGHDHDYERFELQNPNAGADPQGIREFVVGTGGSSTRAFATIRANSRERRTGTFGVLKLTLRPNSYDWQFVSVAGQTLDSGMTACHSGPTAVKPVACRAGYWVSTRGGPLRYVCIRRWKP
jgi:acid phosphatase type 7